MIPGEEIAYLAARILTCGVWVVAGLFKATHFEFAVGEMVRHRIPWPRLVLPAVLALELVGSALLIANWYVWVVALAWIAFMIPASYIYHWFVTEKGIDRVELALFWKNVSIAGGLIALILLDPARPDWLFRG